MGIIRYKIIFGEYLRELRRIMKCKKCKADIPDELHPVYCCYCGEKLQRERPDYTRLLLARAVGMY